MNDLLQINTLIIGTEKVNSVNARETYEYLGLAKGQFSRWIKSAIDKYDFIENEDYITIDTNVEGTKDYIVTLDMAKELCLVSNTAKGKETRKYFINFEKKAKNVIQSQSSQIALLQQMLDQVAIADQRITKIESNFRIENWQQKKLEDIKNRKVYELAEKHGFKDDPTMIRKCHSRVWKKLKDRFSIPRYSELPICEFENGVSFVQKLVLSDIM